MINIAVSLGGTKLSVAIVYPDGTFVETTSALSWREKFDITDEEEYADDLTQKIFENIKKAIKKAGLDKVNTVGISSKGPVDVMKDGTKILGPGEKLTTLPYRDSPLEDKLEEMLFKEYEKYIKVDLIHDGSAAILGEVSERGTLPKEKDACAVIIGTGIGVGVVQNGKLYKHEDSRREYGFDKGLDGLGRYIVYMVKESGYRYDNRIYETKGDKAVLKEGEVHFSERIAGPWLAKRLANTLAKGENFLDTIGIKKKTIDTYLGLWYRKNIIKKITPRKEAELKKRERTLLERLTTAVKGKGAAARKFIISVAEEIGYALAEFIYVFQERNFVENIVLVSAVAENLGKGIEGQHSDDLFIEKIREKAKAILEEKCLSSEKSERLSKGIIRSKISYEREFFAFTRPLSENSKSALSLDDKALAIENLIEAFRHINECENLSKKQKKEIKDILRSLFWKALPYFRKGAKANPIYHNTQVLDNMVRIGLGEKLRYNEFRNATILALLHDIGNAISNKEKVTNSQIRDKAAEAQNKKNEVTQAKTKEERQRLQKEAEMLWLEVKDLATKSMAFRLEHMDKGPELIREITQQFVDEGILKEEDLHFICRAVVIHDYPSIEMSLKELRDIGVECDYAKGDYLLPFDNSPFGRLITFLREADRLFMVSEQGVKKDLGDPSKPNASKNFLKKLKSNEKRHKDEYKLYKESNRDVRKFINETLYRTETGYSIFTERCQGR